jgi:hypothetical protein
MSDGVKLRAQCDQDPFARAFELAARCDPRIRRSNQRFRHFLQVSAGIAEALGEQFD